MNSILKNIVLSEGFNKIQRFRDNLFTQLAEADEGGKGKSYGRSNL